MDAAAMTVLSEIQIGPIMRKNWKIILGSYVHCCSETHAQCLGRRLNMECRQSGIVNYSLSQAALLVRTASDGRIAAWTPLSQYKTTTSSSGRFHSFPIKRDKMLLLPV